MRKPFVRKYPCERPRPSPIYATWGRIPYGLSTGACWDRERLQGRFRPSVPLVHKCSRDKDFAVWCSCCQRAVCPLRLRAQPLWVLSGESDSLVPYFMQDFLLIRILSPCAVFMHQCRNFSCGRLLGGLELRERKVDPHLSSYSLFTVDAKMTSDACVKTCKWESSAWFLDSVAVSTRAFEDCH